MEISTPKATRRCTRLRAEIPIIVTSMDRRHPFSDECVAIVVSPQGCGVRTAEALPLETPVLLSELPGGGKASGRVASCLPLGNGGKNFLLGVSLYNYGNVWGIADPPADWNAVVESDPAPSPANAAPAGAPKLIVNKKVWPYNLPAEGNGTRSRRK